MLIAWSGHRPDVFRQPVQAEAAVRAVGAGRVAAGVQFLMGGQRGVDQWAARLALQLGIPFHFVLPTTVERFTRDWAAEDRYSLAELMSRCASLSTIDPAGALGALAYDLRNETIVRRADALVVVWTGLRRGGTFHTISAARARALPVAEMLLEGVRTGEIGAGERGL